ncbi:MAG: glycosyltransferase family 2 protein [Deltaproteobacteria bacterium]|nr:glycosyltransferase family 2 protein [Deltaproteobacteria bacterium]
MDSLVLPFGPIVLGVYYSILLVLALFGAHRAYLVFLYWRSGRKHPPTPESPREWPVVTVQLPLYNEMYVAKRLIDSVCRFDYPVEKLEIQVLDDSTDETTEVVAQAVAKWRSRGFDIHHIHRKDRSGFKAGALEAGLGKARGDLIAVFDADFIPPEKFLREAVPHFSQPDIGMVQACWQHLNRRYSLLTRVQAIFLDGHFMIEHTARNRSGCFFNFNGTAGIWRRRAIEDGGGWQHDTLTEDLDLSYRSQLAGWRFLYLPTLEAPSELPVDIHGFKAQQHRWSKGSIQTGRKLLLRLLRAKLPLKVKLEGFVHLTNNFSYVLMMLLSILVFPAMVLRRDHLSSSLLSLDLPLFMAATGSVIIFYIVSQIARGDGWLRQIAFLPALMGLGIGLSVNNAGAVLTGLFEKGGVFHRTPKYSIVNRSQVWRAKRYRANKSFAFVVEGLLALYLGFCLVTAIRMNMWLSLPFLYLFFHGYTYMFLLSIVPNKTRKSSELISAEAR